MILFPNKAPKLLTATENNRFVTFVPSPICPKLKFFFNFFKFLKKNTHLIPNSKNLSHLL
jgi:hypothetical protein